MVLRFSLLTATTLLFLLALSQSAPAPPPANPVNVTQILDNGIHYTFLLRLLKESRMLIELENRLNNLNQGFTLFAPNDTAFHDLPLGTLNINKLYHHQKVKLVFYHLLSTYYSIKDLDNVTFPDPTQGAGIQGILGLYFYSQVNGSSGVAETLIKNPLRQTFPLAVYPVDKVSLPAEFIIVGPAPKGSSKTTPAKKSAKVPSLPTQGSSSVEGFFYDRKEGETCYSFGFGFTNTSSDTRGKPG